MIISICLTVCFVLQPGGKSHEGRDSLCFVHDCVCITYKLRLAHGRHSIRTHGKDEETPKNIKDYKISNLLLELFSHYDHTSCAETPNLFSCHPESQVL